MLYGNEGYGSYRYDNVRREDPALREKVQQVIDARRAALRRAAALLREAEEVLAPLAQFHDDAIFNRQVQSVADASESLARDVAFDSVTGKGSTYVGNLAAGPLGEQIQKMGASFPDL